MRAFLMQALDDAGYRRRERLLCPTRLGIPMKRSRYYLVASLDSVPGWRPVRAHRRRVESYTIRPVDPDLYLDAAFLERFHGKLPISDPVGFPRVGVFTSAYGKSPVFAGSYWQDEGGVRHFSPREGLRFLDFPDGLSLAGLGFRRAWNLVGNSLSTTSVREVLRPLLQSR